MEKASTIAPTTRPTQPRSWRRAIAAGAALVTAGVGLFATRSHHFVHHNERVLLEMASSTSIRVQFTTKNTSASSLAGLTITGLLFPRTTTQPGTTDGLAFDGRLSYEFLGNEYNFTMVDGRGYVTVEDVATRTIDRNDCLHRENIPPVHSFVDALRDARVVDDAEALGAPAASCADGKLVEFTFAGESYVFCSRANGHVDKVHGDDLEATVQLLRDNTESAPSLDSLVRPGGERIEDCELLVDEDEETSSDLVSSVHAARILRRTASRARDVAAVLTGRRRLATSDDCSTACKGGKKVCLFVHGLGKDLEAPVADTYDGTWGEAAWKDMNCCSQTKFMRMDTTHNPWYTDVLSSQVCAAAVKLTGSKDPMNLENIAIISHSMGNLIVATAAVKSLCGVGKTSKWIALAGPIRGSQSANLGFNICGGKVKKAVNETSVETLTSVNVCPAGDSTRSLVYEKSDDSFKELDKLYDQAVAEFKQRVTSSLCGVSSLGLASSRSAKYFALGLISGHHSDHDGAVEINSCGAAFGVANYQESWSGGHLYRASVNHADASLHSGDGLWGDARKPVKWLNCQF